MLYEQTLAAACDPRASSNVIMAILTGQAAPDEPESDKQSGALLHFHQRLAHLAYDTVERMERDPASGIVLTDRESLTCISCTQGNQSKNVQLKKDAGANSPIDRVGGVICSYLKVPNTRRTDCTIFTSSTLSITSRTTVASF